MMMNSFQQEQDESLKSQQDESSRLQESQENSRQKSFLLEMILQQQFEFKMMKMKLEMMKLEAQKLTDQKELTEKDISIQSSTSNEFTASIYQQDKIDIFYKYIAFRALKLIF